MQGEGGMVGAVVEVEVVGDDLVEALAYVAGEALPHRNNDPFASYLHAFHIYFGRLPHGHND